MTKQKKPQSQGEVRQDSRCHATPVDSSLDRRSFLRRTGSAALGIGAMGLGVARLAAAAPVKQPTIKRYVTLGKTGLKVSDIGFGSGGCRSPVLVRHCLDRGVNYFDTAEWYRAGKYNSGAYIEEFIGVALKGRRPEAIIATKFIAKVEHDRHRIMKELEGSLRRLQTDYVDIFMNHAVNDVERLKNPEWHEFVELAKKQGKIRFSGMSGHAGNLLECLDYALDTKMVDVILVAYNFGSDPAFYEKFTKAFDIVANQKGLPRLLERAQEQGVGVIAMKTLMGAKLNDLTRFQTDGAKFRRAAFRWVFQDPNIDALIVSMNNPRTANENIACSGDPWSSKVDAEVLKRYVAQHSADYCRNACERCVSSCSYGVPIADVLRQRMYAEKYGNRDLARLGYVQLGAGASPCLTCREPTCANACNYGLDIPSLTRATARRLG